MSRWDTESALMQTYVDLRRLNEKDGHELQAIERRIKGRSRLLKMLKRYFRNQGLVNISGDYLNPYWVSRDSLPK